MRVLPFQVVGPAHCENEVDKAAQVSEEAESLVVSDQKLQARFKTGLDRFFLIFEQS